MFDIGQQIVCVDDNFEYTYWSSIIILPIKNMIYTIRGIIPPNKYKKEATVVLEEIVNPIIVEAGNVEYSWYFWHFRPVKKTNIDIFREILHPINHDELID